MLDQTFEVIIVKSPEMFNRIDLYVLERRGKTISLAQPVEFVFKDVEEVKQNSPQEPTMKLNGLFAKAFLKAWSEALAKEGIKPDDQSEIKGRLEATKYHLEDLRKLVFKIADVPKNDELRKVDKPNEEGNW